MTTVSQAAGGKGTGMGKRRVARAGSRVVVRRALPGQAYFDTLREQTQDEEVLAAIDKAEKLLAEQLAATAARTKKVSAAGDHPEPVTH